MRLFGVSALTTCNETCFITGRLTLGTRTIGLASSSLSAAGVRLLRVTLTPFGRALISMPGAKSLALRLAITDAANNSTFRTLFVTAF